MDNPNKQKMWAELESKKKRLETFRDINLDQLKQLYRTLSSGKPLNGSEEDLKNRKEKENEEYNRQIAEIVRSMSQLP